MSDLISIQNAQETILSKISPAPLESCLSETAFGRVLAMDIYSPIELPPFTNSSMDGFAVHSKDVISASREHPIQLPVSMDIPAGAVPSDELVKGYAARILTGAVLPSGADAVIPLENTDQNQTSQGRSLPAFVTFFTAIKPGENVRPAGEDLKKGQLILKKGRTLQPQDVGLLISLGIREVKVSRKPRIALFSSGDELLTPGQALAPGKIYDANRYVLTGLLTKAGAEVIELEIARDNRKSVVETLERTIKNSPDLILSSAGVSVGVFDYVRQVIEENGSLDFWRVNMRPGKPVAFGDYKGIPFLGLPGNPVSAYIGCLVFVLPILRHLQGLPAASPHTVKAILKEALPSPDGRESYYRGVLTKGKDGLEAALAGHQGSGNLYSLVQANALLIVPAGVKHIAVGETVNAWLLEEEIE
jgi:molybdopterin molybdotransferase